MTALRLVAHRLTLAGTHADVPAHKATRFIPLVGVLVGAIGAAAYWLAAQVWPTSVAVMLSMLATALVTADFDYGASANERVPGGESDAQPARFGVRYWAFLLLIEYNALMALSAASLPFHLPEYCALGLIMVAGHAASRGLVVSVMATHAPSSLRVTTNDLSVALIIGFAPAALLGIPGLVGLVAAILMRLALTTYILPRTRFAFQERLDTTQQLTEACFYLGVLGTWKYI
jgi:adenosylcobinamide-GDP ribazoletransferase